MAEYKFGTREWAVFNMNIFYGCKNLCKYCYASADAFRFGRIKDRADWGNMKESDVRITFEGQRMSSSPRKLDGRIMFPTTHDIIYEHIERTIDVLAAFLSKGNEILIVSKPDIRVVQALCNNLEKYRSQITFRFTIGSLNNDVLKFWETNAPGVESRIQSLEYAFTRGFNTSVSAEPYLHYDVVQLVERVLPLVTDTVWVGKMNYPKQRVNMDGWTEKELKYMRVIEEISTVEFIKNIYNNLLGYDKVKFKESIKKVLGLPPEENIG